MPEAEIWFTQSIFCGGLSGRMEGTPRPTASPCRWLDLHRAVGRRPIDRRASMRVRVRRGLRFGFGLGILVLASSLLSGCFLLRSSSPQPPALFDLKDGEVYGPVMAPPIFIRLGQSVVRASGSVGPSDGPEGSPAIWEGHALALEPDRERNRTVFFYVQGENL